MRHVKETPRTRAMVRAAAVLAALAIIVGVGCREMESPAPPAAAGVARPAGAAEAAVRSRPATSCATWRRCRATTWRGGCRQRWRPARPRLPGRPARRARLAPAFGDGGWEQRVPIVGVTSRLPESWWFRAPSGSEVAFRLGDEYTGASGVQRPSVAIDGAEIVFVATASRPPRKGGRLQGRGPRRQGPADAQRRPGLGGGLFAARASCPTAAGRTSSRAPRARERRGDHHPHHGVGGLPVAGRANRLERRAVRAAGRDERERCSRVG